MATQTEIEQAVEALNRLAASNIVAEEEALRTVLQAYQDLQNQVHRLATFIIVTFPGEPSMSEGAIDTAIRLLQARS